jgi:DNA-binding protein HU-beta
LTPSGTGGCNEPVLPARSSDCQALRSSAAIGVEIDPDRPRSHCRQRRSNPPILLSSCDTFEGTPVNKTELIEHIARQADISKAAAARALEAVIGGVKTTLKKNNTVSLVGFGTFSVGKRAARSGRNPRTGAAIKIKAAKVPKFRPGKALKDALN